MSSKLASLLPGALAALILSGAAHPAGAVPAALPDWLAAHIGTGEGEIAEPVLQRARALYRGKVESGAVNNSCYFAMDATKPNDPDGGRFYEICEAERVFRVLPAGHGSGRNLGAAADFSNGRRCAKNFGNAQDSELTTGGVYTTSEIRTSFKGYYSDGGGSAPFLRSFIPFVGEGDTANARAREIGGHAAVTLKNVCLRHDPGSRYADASGYVPFGTLVSYPGGRSNGCTSWSPTDAARIAEAVKDSPTTLYIYPESKDIRAFTHASAKGHATAAGPYWNASCLKEIGAPRFWSRGALEPVISRFKREHPAPPPRPTPLCRGE